MYLYWFGPYTRGTKLNAKRAQKVINYICLWPLKYLKGGIIWKINNVKICLISRLKVIEVCKKCIFRTIKWWGVVEEIPLFWTSCDNKKKLFSTLICHLFQETCGSNALTKEVLRHQSLNVVFTGQFCSTLSFNP